MSALGACLIRPATFVDHELCACVAANHDLDMRGSEMGCTQSLPLMLLNAATCLTLITGLTCLTLLEFAV